MRSVKGKKKQSCPNQKDLDSNETGVAEEKQERQTLSAQQVQYDSIHQQQQMQLSENDGDDEKDDGDDGHSDGVGSQRSWSPVIKPRRRFTASEIQFLEAEYGQDVNPSTDKLEIIARTIGTTRRIINTWFQNHRAKGKRNSNSINKVKKPKHVRPKSRARRKNITQPEMIGSTVTTPGPSCACINQTTANDDDYHVIFSATSTRSDHAASGTPSPLDMSDPSLPAQYTYDPSYFVQDPTLDMIIPPTTTSSTNATVTATNWNQCILYPVLSSSTLFNAWSQSPTAALSTPPSLVNQPTLPQCCVDELYTGYPCPFHTLYL